MVRQIILHDRFGKCVLGGVAYGQVQRNDGVAAHGIGESDGRGAGAFGVGDTVDPGEGVAGVNGHGAVGRTEHGDGDGGDAVAAGEGGRHGVGQHGVGGDGEVEAETVVGVAVTDAGGGVDAHDGVDVEVHGKHAVGAGHGREGHDGRTVTGGMEGDLVPGEREFRLADGVVGVGRDIVADDKREVDGGVAA